MKADCYNGREWREKGWADSTIPELPLTMVIWLAFATIDSTSAGT
jgi:hypothetical protein